MGYGLQLVSPPATEPLSVDGDVRPWLRLEVSDDDTLLAGLVTSAREYVERAAGLQLMPATWLLTSDRFPRYSSSAVWQQYSDGLWDQRIPQTELSGRWWPDKAAIRLPRPPLQSVTSITYVDGTGAQVTLAPANYLVDTARMPGRITPSYGNIWPIIRQQLNAVQVTFVAGFSPLGTAPYPLPWALKTAMLLLLADWYENRGETAPAPTVLDRVLALVDSVWRSYGLGS